MDHNHRKGLVELSQHKQHLNEQYAQLYQQYQSAKGRSLSPIDKTDFQKRIMHSASTRLQIYKRDNHRMKERLTALETYSSRLELEQHIKSQETELKQLEKLNQRLNKAPEKTPTLPQKAFTTEEIKELNYYKREVSKLQTDLEKNQQKLRSLEQECQELLAEQTSLKEKVQNTQPDNSELHKKHQWLEKKLEILKAARISHAETHKLRVKRLEQELKTLDEEHLRLQMENMKKGQQARLFNIEKQRMSTRKIGNMDDWTPNVDFIYKPSINRIYYT